MRPDGPSLLYNVRHGPNHVEWSEASTEDRHLSARLIRLEAENVFDFSNHILSFAVDGANGGGRQSFAVDGGLRRSLNEVKIR